MKQKLKIVSSLRMGSRRLRIVRKPVQLSVVTSATDLVPDEESMQSGNHFLKRCLDLFGAFLKRLDEFATESRETDERIRKIRTEHYAKYGWYFRDRF